MVNSGSAYVPQRFIIAASGAGGMMIYAGCDQVVYYVVDEDQQ